MAYNLYLLGDYMTGNKDLNGFVELGLHIGEIITAITRLDAAKGRKALVSSIMILNKLDKYV